MPINQRRVLILSEIIAPYRIPVFNALARSQELDLLVVFLAETDSGLRQWPIYKDEIRFQYQVLPSWRIRAGRHNLLLNRGLRSCLKKFSPDSIICGGYNYYASWEALSWTRRHKAAFILWSESNAQDSRNGNRWIESLKKRFIAGCDLFVVPGQASQEYLQALGSLPDDIVVAPNAVDNDWFQTRSDSARATASVFREKLKLPDRYILFVGRLVREKGIFDLLEAYAKLEESVRSKVGLVFAGDGRSKTELQREAQRIIPGTILFAGFTHREDLVGLYALAEALILPTHTDPWGLVVNEAMACGLPIVVTHLAGCARDLVKNGWNGFVVPARDPQKLKDAIESIVGNLELRQKMSIRSSERIRNYSPEACARGLAEAVLREGTIR